MIYIKLMFMKYVLVNTKQDVIRIYDDEVKNMFTFYDAIKLLKLRLHQSIQKWKI